MKRRIRIKAGMKICPIEVHSFSIKLGKVVLFVISFINGQMQILKDTNFQLN